MLRPSLLACGALLAGLVACGAERPGPNILLITLDTTRADHMSCYGYEKRTTPRIDELARDAMRYENAYAVTSWTLPSHASIFTGKFPSAHGAHYSETGKINLLDGIQGAANWKNYRANTLADDEVTLAQTLSEEGYTTGGIVAGPWMKRVFGLDRGFDTYDDSNFQNSGGLFGELNGRPAEDVTRAAKRFVDEHQDEPFFLFLNYYDPHAPYNPAAPEYLAPFWSEPIPPAGEAQEAWDFQIALYDAEILYTDRYVGELLDHLKALDLYEDMWILLTADHGELLGEHGMGGHGNWLSEAEIKIPLIVKEPGADRPRGTHDALVQQVDLMPTLLDALGLPHPPNMQGTVLGQGNHPILAEVYPVPAMSTLGDWQSLIEDDYKLLWGSRGQHFLFDLEKDPRERDNLFERQPAVAEAMRAKLSRYIEELPEPGHVSDRDEQVGLELLEDLKNMGYVGDDAVPGGDENGGDQEQ